MALMDLIITLLLVALLILSHHEVGVRGKSISEEEEEEEEDLELERQLKRLNKPPIKTIQTEGDVFDCVDIYKQPTLEHPMLKNHKIQMRPTSSPNGVIAGASSVDKHARAALNSIDCPEGTVPIRRTRKHDLIRAKSFSSTNIHPQKTEFPGQHLAILRLENIENKRYNGAQGIINVYNVTVEADQSSSSQIWIENGPSHDELNSLQAGWMVSPQLFDDSLTRTFIYWSVDGGKRGCFNTLCLGFVQIDKNNPVGTSIPRTSTYDGSQFAIHVLMFKDNVTGDWWLKVNEVNVGYWPKSLLPHLGEGATHIAWGGLVKGPPNKASPQMGNGHFPAGNFRRACYFRLIQMVDASHDLVNPCEVCVEVYKDCPKGYDVQYIGYMNKISQYGFLFGGPGGTCGM